MDSYYVLYLVSSRINDVLVQLPRCHYYQLLVRLEQHVAVASWCHQVVRIAVLGVVQLVDMVVGCDLSCGKFSVQLVYNVHCIPLVLH